MVLKTIEFSGAADPQRLPLPYSHSPIATARLLVSGNGAPVAILQENDPDGPRIIIPVGGGQTPPLPLYPGRAPGFVLVDESEAGPVLVTVVQT